MDTMEFLLAAFAPAALVAFWCGVIAATTRPRSDRDARADALARTLGEGQ